MNNELEKNKNQEISKVFGDFSSNINKLSEEDAADLLKKFEAQNEKLKKIIDLMKKKK